MKLARTVLAISALPLALGLAACGKKDDAGTGAEASAPLPTVAAPAGQQWSDPVVKTPDNGYLMGNPDAPIKVIEYGSLTCPHCAEFTVKGFPKMRDDYINTGRVSLEYRNFVRDPYDTTMAMLTHCGAPESFYALTDAVFANQPAIVEKLKPVAQELQNANLPPNQTFVAIGTKGGLVDFFSSRGIAKDQALACLANVQTAKQLADDVQSSGEKYNITGTPTFIINGKNVEVATWEALEPILQRAGAR